MVWNALTRLASHNEFFSFDWRCIEHGNPTTISTREDVRGYIAACWDADMATIAFTQTNGKKDGVRPMMDMSANLTWPTGYKDLIANNAIITFYFSPGNSRRPEE
jgi:hypothetical protein